MKDLERALERWVAADLISHDQAQRILRAESSLDRGGRRIPLLTEVIGYLGAAFVLTAAVAAASQTWPDLAMAEKLLSLALATGLLWAGGWWIRANEEPAIRRLSSVLWFLSIGGMAFLVHEVAAQGLDVETGAALPAALIASAYAALLYLRRRASLQQIALFGGVVLSCAGISDVTGGSDWFGPLVWGAGWGWLWLARRALLVPLRTGLALGSTGILIGSQAAAIEFFASGEGWGIALGLLSAAGLLGLSVLLKQIVLLGFGVGGLFLFLPQAIDEYLADDLGGPLALFLVGIGCLLAALTSVRLKQRIEGKRRAS